MRDSSLIRVIATCLLSGRPTVDEVTLRLSRTLGHPWRWIRPFAQRYAKAFDGQTRPRHRDVVAFLLRDSGFHRARSKHDLLIQHWLSEPQQMQPVEAATGWNVPVIESTGDLAAWLNIAAEELQWLADLKGLNYKSSSPQLDHYHYLILSKQYGNIRLIEAPKPRLKKFQQKILRQILEKIPSHPAVHGFVKGRSIKTFATPHVGKQVVLRMDLQNFFPSFTAARIQALFRTMGYLEPVANLLGGICTNAVSRGFWRRSPSGSFDSKYWEASSLYFKPHLPQGAPTSPALANCCSYRLDCRLAGLAAAAGAQYTRYADDLAFSGRADFARYAERFSIHVAAILSEEGFTVHHRKTRLMRQGVRQHLAGLVTNQHVNVMRPDFDRLKAILTNCIRSGPAAQNRDTHPNFRAHLEGRVSFVEMINAKKALKLRRLFEQIQWQ